MEDYSNSQPMSFTNDIVYRAKYVQEALEQGIKFGSNTFRVYHQLRWFECEGKYEWSVAGSPTLAKCVNLTEKEVKNALDELKKRGIVQHILTDTRWYRKKTDLWATTIELKKRGIDYEKYCIQAHNKSPQEVLKTEQEPNKTAGVPAETAGVPAETAGVPADATPVFTGVGNNNINKKEMRERAGSADASPATSPFFGSVSHQKENLTGTRDCKKYNSQDMKKLYALGNDLVALMGLSEVKAGTKLRTALQARLKEGYSVLTLREIARWSTTQTKEFYRVPHSLFSETGVASALALMKETKPKLTTTRTI